MDKLLIENFRCQAKNRHFYIALRVIFSFFIAQRAVLVRNGLRDEAKKITEADFSIYVTGRLRPPGPFMAHSVGTD